MTDTLFDVFNLLLWGCAWYCVARAVYAFTDFLEKNNHAKEIQTEVEEKLMDLVHTVKQEKHDDVYYWFDDDNHRFLAQGKTSNEIIVHLRERFNHDVFILENDKLLVGPEFNVIDIKNRTPEEVGKFIADAILHKILPTQN